MAALLSDADAQRENERDERHAQGWETVGRCRHGAVSGGAFRCECAFTYINAVFRENLTVARAQECEPRAHSARHRRRIRRCHRHRAVSRDDVAMHVGRERPLRAGRGAQKGAAEWGSLTPRCTLCSVATAAPTSDRRHKAPPAADGKPRIGKKMGVRHCAAERCDPVLRETVRLSAGNGAPEFRVPHPVPSEVSSDPLPGKSRRADDDEADER